MTDPEAIASVLARYCHGLDDRDLDTLAAITTDDLVTRHGDWFRTAGRDQWLAVLATPNPRLVATQHVVSNVLVDVDVEGDGLTARGRASMQALHVGRAEDGSTFAASGWASYRLEFRRDPITPDGWRIAAIDVEHLWDDPGVAVIFDV